MGGDLFQRLLLRFLLGLTLAFLLFLTLVHVFQRRVIEAEWSSDIRQETHWVALHTRPDDPVEVLARAWGTIHSTIRLTIFGSDRQVLADSQPDLPAPDLDALLRGERQRYLAAVESIRSGGWVVMSRPGIPAFPHGLQWELITAAVVLLGLVVAFLLPLVRSMRATFRELTAMAAEVSSGHFGKTLASGRSDELGPLVQAFNGMSQKLAEVERLNTRLLHDVSHELRSPLGRIQVLAQSIPRRPDQMPGYILGIEQEVALLDRLVGDLVDTARLEAHTELTSLQEFPLYRWAVETLQRLESRVRASQIEWTVQLPDRLAAHDVTVRGDPQRLAQAIGNLIDNATHALEGRADGAIEVRLEASDRGWSIAVKDNGPGIPAEHLPHVFRRFYRVDEHRSRGGTAPDPAGVGLGLSLVRAIVEAHGGTIRLDSNQGSGTRATLSFPSVHGATLTLV